jgi:protein-S-isoprenylcysteine O-methyltransferase Ste14
VSIWRHLRAIGLLPGVGTIVIPAAIVYVTDSVSIGWGLPFPLSGLPLLLGCTMIGLGLFLMYRTISLFATAGRGTLAPWDPTRRLVVRGPYRHVRNPMISGVLAVLLGEAAVLGSLPLLAWFLGFFCLNAIYMPLVEERSLERRFGADYLAYKRNVPRWIPRLRPWAAGGN